ncbi:MAG: hypothetical protein CL610_19540 [Anaerolineaceae bacterium]|nr:hypothetical protein [Anaerolineaceae bacterium]
MQEIDFQEIIRLLGPNAGNGLIWNIFIYLIFILTFITMLLQGDKALMTTIISASGLLLCVIDKLVIFDPREFGTLVIHAGMFLFPALVAGMTRDTKSRPPAIFASIIGAVYFFLFWLLLQR